MKIIYNSIIPFQGFLCINLFGILFVRKELKHKMTKDVYRHEAIHTKQMLELLIILYYIIYVFEWLFRLLFTKDAFSHKAYKNISFEREAYWRENYPENYLETRKHFAQWRLHWDRL